MSIVSLNAEATARKIQQDIGTSRDGLFLKSAVRLIRVSMNVKKENDINCKRD